MITVKFNWSFIYEETIHAPTVKSKFNYEEYEKYIKSFLSDLEPEWRNIEKKIFKYMEEITGLTWKKEEITTYIIKKSSIMPISDPLTIPIEFEAGEDTFTLSRERYLDMLVHELIHNLFIQNEKEMGDYFGFILEKYKDEEFDTPIHLLLHAIHKKIFLKFFEKDRLDGEIEMSSFYPAYKRSWEIVNDLGEDLIIKEFKDYAAGFPNAKA